MLFRRLRLLRVRVVLVRAVCCIKAGEGHKDGMIARIYCLDHHMWRRARGRGYSVGVLLLFLLRRDNELL